MKPKYILGIDTGTEKTGYCIIKADLSELVEFGKIENAEMLSIIDKCSPDDTMVVFERFAPQTSIGMTTITSIMWYGKYIRECETHGFEYDEIFRRDVKKHLLGKFSKANGSADSQIRKALVARLARFDKANGKGTKANPDFFYGVATTDVYAAIAVATTWRDKNESCN